MNETEISRQCLDALRLAYPAPRSWWERCNTGKARVRGSHITYGLGNGTPDIIGCALLCISEIDVGVLVGVEIKKPGRDPDPDQVEWRKRHEAAGGIFVLAHSAREAIDGVREKLNARIRRAA